MQKKIPQRQCMGCRERKDKRDMLRVVRCTDGSVRLDFSGKLNGWALMCVLTPNVCVRRKKRSPWSAAWR